MTTSSTAPARPAGRILKIVGAGLLILGLVIAAISITETVHKVSGAVVDTFSGPVFTTPGEDPLQLKETGTYLIMQELSYRRTANSSASVPAVGPGDAAVIGPDGRELTLTATSGATTITRGPRTYFDIMKFQVPARGVYRLSVFEPSGVSLIVVPSLGDSFGRALPWVGLGLLGGLALITGVILLIVGFVRAGKAKRAAPAAYGGYPGYATPPPGWYPDPGRPGASRWWDGTRWRP